MSGRRPGLPAFNEMEHDTARSRLLTCLDVPRWADEVLAARPFETLDDLEARMVETASTITDDELERALARHPRIGERPDAATHDAGHSTREQAGVDRDDADVARRLAEGNLAYEERFDRVFIIRAAGRDATEILEALRRRMDNSDRAERAETIDQLTQIALLRVREVLG
ncbi:2-oxo-4-hydroxy-4-carboxy-5-ureidoimidazoline decarboxylase [Nocardioides sp. P5_C9_2]